MSDNVSQHYSTSREARNEFISSTFGNGTLIDSFIVDRGHAKGAEIHEVYDTGVIEIRNALTKKLITKIIARPEQLRKLYGQNNQQPPKWLLNKAYKNNFKRYNDI